MSKRHSRIIYSFHHGSWSVEHVVPKAFISTNLDAIAAGAKSAIYIEGDCEQSAWEGLAGQWGSPRPARVPVICEWLMCLAVDPEFQKDRLADYQERFNSLWVPKFGRRMAVVMYGWHVLRQSRLIDWLIRVFGWGDRL